MDKILYKSFLTILFVFSLAEVTLAYNLSQELTVLSSNEKEFDFRIKNRLASLEKQVEEDSSVTFFRTVHVGIPHGARVTLLSVQGDSLTPVRDDKRKLEKTSQRSYPLAVVSDPITVRGRQFVAVQIFPVAGRALYREVALKLGFTGGLTTGGVSSNDPQFDRIFQATLANFDQFKSWPVPARALPKAAQPGDTLFSTVTTWYKIAVNQSGFCKITGDQLEQAGLVLDNLQSDSIHLYNGGGLPLEVQDTNSHPGFTEVAILVEDGKDGVFNSRDYIVFYGEPVDRWLYTADQPPRFVNNPYTDRNLYWLAVSGFSQAGRRMSQIDAAPNGPVDTIITTFRRRVHSEQDNLLWRANNGRITNYYTWYWTNDSELIFFVPAPGLVEGDTANVWLYGQTADNDDPDDMFGFMDLYVNGTFGMKTYCDRYRCSYRTAALVEGFNEIRLWLWPDISAPPHFDYMNLEYTGRLIPQDNVLDITLGTFAGEAQIEVVDDFNYPEVVLDLANSLQPAILTGYERTGGQITFRVELTAETPNRFYLATIQQAHGPLSIERVSPINLRAADQRADLLIITPKKFAGAMDEYIDYRSLQGYSIALVSIEDITDNFSYGLYDPTAIRNFLKYAYEYYPSPVPSAVLLVGDGNYDFLDHLGTGLANYVPPYLHAYDTSASDDNYVYFGAYGILDSDTSYDTSYVTQDRGYDMTIARWPVRSQDEINTIVAKTKRYESPSSLGIWRTNISLVADDEHAVRSSGHVYDETFHTTQTEELEKDHIPPLFNRNKIYLWEYPFVNWEKPAVNDAIVNSINDGTLLVNFVGHGNPDVWAHEHVFTRMGDLPRLANYDRLALFLNASCALGFFDDPKREGMAEDLLVHRTGGAVGVISATRLVYASDNALFNQKVYDVMLNNDSLSIGEAVYTAKLLRQYKGLPIPSPVKNDRAYLFFGDPYVKLGMPQLGVEFSDTPDSLTALGRTHISGRVLDEQNQLFGKDGTLLINVYDSERQKTYRLLNSSGEVTQEIDYCVTGPTIFRGSAGITGGFFEFEFISPLDIGYGGQGAKIVVYAIFDATDAAGLIDSLTVSDSIVALADSVGPKVEYAFPGRANFITGDFVSNKDLLEVTLSDSTGINLTGGLGHGITLELDGRSENTINLTDRFEYNQDDCTSGKLAYPLEEIEPGRHTFKIKAWDNANNSATVEFAAEIIVEENLSIIDLLNYPNPMKDSTRFSAYLSHPVERFLLEIFTLSGRKIRTFGPHCPPPGYFDDIIWYGRDNSGDRVATGVYIYKVTAIPATGGDKVESFGKVVVIN
jgi:hypothetical protein